MVVLLNNLGHFGDQLQPDKLFLETKKPRETSDQDIAGTWCYAYSVWDKNSALYSQSLLCMFPDISCEVPRDKTTISLRNRRLNF